ncbi:uncharacterized protein FOMMEDRAFT_159044, partial [Fomitiporia mediterranea MF3/22]|uniref:uncharacterized protein n=1 Tax=Fomitiporia mediterranea (strain MF3/22) TaxID=694068 RepID=UPI00044074F0
MTFKLADLPTVRDLEAIANASREDIEDGLRKILGKEYPNPLAGNDASWEAGTFSGNDSGFDTSTPQ